MRMRTAVSALILFCSGCGGGGSSSPVGSVGGTGEWCDLPYYKNITGTYVGTISFESIINDTGTEWRNCQWETRLTITGESILNKCFMQMQLNAVPNQSTVLDSSDPNAYQCRGDENRIYRIIDPNQNANDEDILSQVGFPVSLRQSGHDLVPSNGPYFGDENVSASHIYLFASGGSVADQLLVSDAEYLDLIGPTSTALITNNFQSRLMKEVTP